MNCDLAVTFSCFELLHEKLPNYLQTNYCSQIPSIAKDQANTKQRELLLFLLGNRMILMLKFLFEIS